MIDSGATNHLTPFKEDFVHLFDQTAIATVANGHKVKMYGPGKVIIKQEGYSWPITLHGVWHVPSARHRLMSVPALTKNGFRCEIVKDRSSFWDNKGNLVMQASALSPDNILHWIRSSQIIPSVNVISLSPENSYQLWHERLGHTSKNALKAMSQNLKGVPSLSIPSTTSPCKGCQLGKQTECTYLDSSKHAQKIGRASCRERVFLSV